RQNCSSRLTTYSRSPGRIELSNWSGELGCSATRGRMRITNDYYLIVDLEATCSDVGVVPRHEMEIIEIGAVMQSSSTFEVESEFQPFVRPVRHPELTEFCTELTGITPENMVGAPLFREALEAMKEWMHTFDDALFCSWGDYDRDQFLQDCEFHQVVYPFRSG